MASYKGLFIETVNGYTTTLFYINGITVDVFNRVKFTWNLVSNSSIPPRDYDPIADTISVYNKIISLFRRDVLFNSNLKITRVYTRDMNNELLYLPF